MATADSLAAALAAAAAAAAEPRICEKGGKGLFLPLGGDSENTSSKPLRAFLYAIMLIYFFYGVGCVSDYFMAGIETITSKKKLVINKRTGRSVTVLVWNTTVANLSLMALGSSAPEILLSLVECFLNDFYAGQLGPSTIVGSAAFNLFCIIAVCITAIPAPEVRRIKELDVFHITAVFSIFAYVWLLIIVSVITPDIIDLGEGLATIIFFPILVAICFCADRGYFRKRGEVEVETGDGTELKRAVTKIANPYDMQHLPPRARSILIHRVHIEHEAAVHHEHVEQKAGHMSAGRGSQVGLTPAKEIIKLPAGEPLPAGDDGDMLRDQYGGPIQNDAGVITFCRDIQVVSGGAEEVKATVYVLRRNGATGQVSCKFHAEHMTAFPGYDYRELEKEQNTLTFEDGVCMATIELTILPVRALEDQEKFQIILSAIKGGASFNPNDDGGEDSAVLTVVIRNDAKKDLKPSLLERCVNVDLVGFGWECYKEQILESLTLEKFGDGDDDDEEDGGAEDKPKEPPPGYITALEYVIYALAVPWKFFYAVMSPPPQWFGGWFLFCVALFHVGFLTAIICDMSSIFGCVLDISDLVTAIIVVAPGTSLPDLFASTSAAKGDDDADASIINVTGSNSVNVFLGIGLSWTMSIIYWGSVSGTNLEKWKMKYPDIAKDHPGGAYVVKGGDMAFSVFVFSACSVIAICILRIRRQIYDGELGGPQNVQYVTASILFSLYVIYVVLSIWKTSSKSADAFQWVMLALAGVTLIGTVAAEMALKAGMITAWKAEDSEEASAEKSPLKDAPDCKTEGGASRSPGESWPARDKDNDDAPPEVTKAPQPDQIGKGLEDSAGSCRSCNGTGTDVISNNPCSCELGQSLESPPPSNSSNSPSAKAGGKKTTTKKTTPKAKESQEGDEKSKPKKVLKKKMSGKATGQPSATGQQEEATTITSPRASPREADNEENAG